MIDCLKLGRVSSNQLQLMKWTSCHVTGQGLFYFLNGSMCSGTNDQATPLRKTKLLPTLVLGSLRIARTSCS